MKGWILVIGLCGLWGCSESKNLLGGSDNASGTQDAKDAGVPAVPANSASDPIVVDGAYLFCESELDNKPKSDKVDVRCSVANMEPAVLKQSAANFSVGVRSGAPVSTSTPELIEDDRGASLHFESPLADLSRLMMSLQVKQAQGPGRLSSSVSPYTSDSQNLRVQGKISLVAMMNHTFGTKLMDTKNWARPINVNLPLRINVFKGNAGNQKATLSFDKMNCAYQGQADTQSPTQPDEFVKGRIYLFQGCDKPAIAGMKVTTSMIQLELLGGDPSQATTIAGVVLDSAP